MNNKQNFDDLKAAFNNENVTHGQWKSDYQRVRKSAPNPVDICLTKNLSEEGYANAYLIAKMHERLPDMLSYIEELEAKVEQLQSNC